MLRFEELSEDDQIHAVTEYAKGLVPHYFDGDFELELINFEFNATFKVSVGGQLYALRININSARSRENLAAEIEFIQYVAGKASVRVPQPILTREGRHFTSGRLATLDREVHSVLYSWLDGKELGDEPPIEALVALGQAMAQLHNATIEYELSEDCDLPILRDFLWLTEDMLFIEKSSLDPEAKSLLSRVKGSVELVIETLFQRDTARPIHADLHGWNVMWNGAEVALFDFDDCGIGLPIQDLATSLYYLDTPEQDEALLSGYKSVRDLPEYTDREMKALLLQRRIILLNYLYETKNHEHRQMAPKYLEKTLAQARDYLEM